MRARTVRPLLASGLIALLAIATFCPVVVWASNAAAESPPVECPTHPSKTAPESTACQTLTANLSAVPEPLHVVNFAVFEAPPIEVMSIWTPVTPARATAVVPIPSDVPLYLFHASLIR